MNQNDRLALLRALGLKGRATPEEAAAAAGLGDVSALIGELLEAGLLREMRGSYLLTPQGRESLSAGLAAERAGVDERVVSGAYEAFTPVNGAFKALASDWQSRDGELNDHSDAAYDAAVLSRLGAIHAEVSRIVDGLGAHVPRLAIYARRLESALDRVNAGDHAWLLKPLIDSYHTVWFELHEELISLAGRTRLEEAAAGRAH